MTKFTPEFIEQIRDGIRHSLTFKFMQKEAAHEFNKALDEIERLQSESALLDRMADYLRHHVEGHKCFDFPDAKALLAEWEGLRGE